VPALEDLQAIDLDQSEVTLWVFKKSGKSAQPSFSGRWVETGDALNAALKETVANARGRISEVNEYGLLAQNNEASALSIGTNETHAPGIVAAAAAEENPRKATQQKHLQNANLYAIKIVGGDNSVIYAVSSTTSSWRTQKMGGMLPVFYSDAGLELDTTARFELSKAVDFFIVGETILIVHKAHFESVLNYKQAHQEDFTELQVEAEFTAVFSDIGPLTLHVGSNKIHLRRMSAIRAKGHYKNAQFMTNLRTRHAQYGLTLVFNPGGQLVATPETCADIIRALLDHRLISPFSANAYDVPDTTQVALPA
jgi:hypothetical protein